MYHTMDPSDKIQWLVVFGGPSAENKVAISSAETICRHMPMESCRYAYIDEQGHWWLLPNQIPESLWQDLNPKEHGTPAQLSLCPHRLTLTTAQENLNSTHVLPMMHGTGSEDGAFFGMLSFHQIPYAGPRILDASITFNKAMTKKIAQSHGIAVTEPYHLVDADYYRANREATLEHLLQKIPLPLFVKPNSQGSSIGITQVTTAADLASALDTAFTYDQQALCEHAYTVREIEVAFLRKPNGEVLISEPGEVIANADFYSYDAKYAAESSSTVTLTPSLTPDQRQQIHTAVATLIDALQLKSLARLDFFLDDQGQLLLNEVNTLPGFTAISLYPQMITRSGMTLSQWLTLWMATAA